MAHLSSIKMKGGVPFIEVNLFPSFAQCWSKNLKLRLHPSVKVKESQFHPKVQSMRFL